MSNDNDGQVQEALPRARADNTAGESSIRRWVGDGDVNLADVWPTITRVGADPKQEEGGACG